MSLDMMTRQHHVTYDKLCDNATWTYVIFYELDSLTPFRAASGDSEGVMDIGQSGFSGEDILAMTLIYQLSSVSLVITNNDSSHLLLDACRDWWP